MGLIPKLPLVGDVTKKKVKIPIIKKTVPLALLALAVGIAVYFYFKKGKGAAGDDEPAKSVNIAPDVKALVSPDFGRPDSFVTVAGTFTDEAGLPVSTKEAFYYVYEENTLEGRRLVASGSLGTDVSKFSRSIPTTNFKPGKHSVLITDEPLTTDDMMGQMNTGPAPFGIGMASKPPTGSIVSPGGISPSPGSVTAPGNIIFG